MNVAHKYLVFIVWCLSWILLMLPYAVDYYTLKGGVLGLVLFYLTLLKLKYFTGL